MKNSSILLLILFLANIVFGQYKEISITTINEKHSNQILVKKDSSVEVFKYPLVNKYYFTVTFFSASYDQGNELFKLTGRVCMFNASNCEYGLPGISIFTGYRDSNNLLHKIAIIDDKLKDRKDIKEGDFDITFKLKKNESLYFFLDSFYYLEEYRLGELIK